MIIEKAILKINPNAEFTVSADDITKITWLNDTTPISVSDIEAQFSIVEQEIADAETKKASGKQKLLDLGLTEEEVKALIGV
jgi:predicted  nucleic acid-binding Zn-ribbon protein